MKCCSIIHCFFVCVALVLFWEECLVCEKANSSLLHSVYDDSYGLMYVLASAETFLFWQSSVRTLKDLAIDLIH